MTKSTQAQLHIQYPESAPHYVASNTSESSFVVGFCLWTFLDVADIRRDPTRPRLQKPRAISLLGPARSDNCKHTASFHGVCVRYRRFLGCVVSYLSIPVYSNDGSLILVRETERCLAQGLRRNHLKAHTLSTAHMAFYCCFELFICLIWTEFQNRLWIVSLKLKRPFFIFWLDKNKMHLMRTTKSNWQRFKSVFPNQK